MSENNYDWLGNGAYFWEWDALRASDWARECYEQPSVVGAVIELGNCLDLTTQDGIFAVENAYQSYVELQRRRNKPLLENKDLSTGAPGNLTLRFLDKAVITHLHESIKQAGIGEYDTVRALFPEGEPIYRNSGFWKKTHVQIAVRRIEQIRGVFRLPHHELKKLNLSAGIYPFSN